MAIWAGSRFRIGLKAERLPLISTRRPPLVPANENETSRSRSGTLRSASIAVTSAELPVDAPEVRVPFVIVSWLIASRSSVSTTAANGSACTSFGSGADATFAEALSAIVGSASATDCISSFFDHRDDSVIEVENRGADIAISPVPVESEISSATTASLGSSDSLTGPSSRIVIPVAADSCRLSSARTQSVETSAGRRKSSPTTRTTATVSAATIFLTSTSQNDRKNQYRQTYMLLARD
nr:MULTISPECIES: hypothetical protein [unclassified Mesorhizobium]